MRSGALGRRAVTGAAVVACAVACSAPSTAPSPATSSGSSTPAAEPLQINFADPPERWRTVATFSYGERADQLGAPGGSRANGAAGGAEPFPPAAIVVADDSLWVLDQVKHRVAHFTLSGRYLGEVRGVSPTARDLARSSSGKLITSHRARFAPTDTDVARGSRAREYTDRFSWTVDLDTLDVRMTPAWDRRYTFPGGHDVVLGVSAVQVAQRHTYFWLGVAGWRAGAGAELLLELDPEGNVASLERVATPSWGGAAEVIRPFYVARDGTVYQWFTTPTHAELRVHP
ncbi:MAG TPA: hypothetical protein VHD81_03390 [Mycobacteriales bacterium]|nr:hypothetical protein [Mycobacteriales bacterium]